MSISDRIHSALQWYEQTTGRHPKNVYLGYEDMMKFKEETDFALTTNPKTHRHEAFGCDIFKVDVEHHLRVS